MLLDFDCSIFHYDGLPCKLCFKTALLKRPENSSLQHFPIMIERSSQVFIFSLAKYNQVKLFQLSWN